MLISYTYNGNVYFSLKKIKFKRPFYCVVIIDRNIVYKRYGHFTMGGVDYNVFVYNVEYQFLGTLLPQIHNIYID